VEKQTFYLSRGWFVSNYEGNLIYPRNLIAQILYTPAIIIVEIKFKIITIYTITINGLAAMENHTENTVKKKILLLRVVGERNFGSKSTTI